MTFEENFFARVESTIGQLSRAGVDLELDQCAPEDQPGQWFGAEALADDLAGAAAPVMRSAARSQWATYQAPARSERQRWVYIVLALLLGGFGVHRFYRGAIATGFAQLGLTVIGLIIPILPWLVLLCWLVMDLFESKDANGLRMR